MRIGIDIRKLRDYGIGTHIQELLKRYPRMAPQHEYILYCAPEDISDPLLQQPCFRIAPEHSRKYSLRELFSLSRKARRDALDLFHAPHYVLPVQLHCPSVVTIHDLIHIAVPQYLTSRIALLYARAMLSYATKRSQKILTVSEFSKKEILRYFTVPENKLVVIHNGVDPQFHPLPLEPSRMLIETRLGVKNKYILYVGNLLKHKNLTVLLEAFALLMKQSATASALSLVIRGGNKRQQELIHKQAGDLAIGERVQFLPKITSEELIALYSACEAFVFPSLYEGFGLPVVEALACGAPTLLSRIPVHEEVAGQAAVYFNPQEPHELCQKLQQVLSDEQMRRRLNEAGIKQAALFDWDRAAQQTIGVYEAVVQEAHR